MDQNVKHLKAILAVRCLPFRQTLHRGVPPSLDYASADDCPWRSSNIEI